MTDTDQKLNIETYLSYEDIRYPILILQSERFGTIGYNLDTSNGELTRVCICHAFTINECLCGAWEVED
jgi:hypothetical protein